MVLADTGRQTPAGLSLLQVGWKATFGLSQPDGSVMLPEQAVVAFVEAEFGEVNRVHEAELRLVNADEVTQQIRTPRGLIPAEVHRQVLAPQVLGATAGSDSLTPIFIQFPAGSLSVSAPGWYRWICTIGEARGEMGFQVNPQPNPQTFGPLPGSGGPN